MIFAVFFFSLMNVGVKMLRHIPAAEIVFFRSIISFFISITILKHAKVNIFGNNKKILIARGLAGAVALILYFQMIQEIPLASAYVILFLAPIFTTILGIFIVKEKVHPLQWVFSGIAFTGILMVQGFDNRVPLYHLFLGIGASIASGLAYNFIRVLKDSEHPLVIIFYFPLVTAPITGLISYFNWKTPSGMDWVYLLSVGVLTQIAQYFMTKSYQMEELSKVASIRYLGIVYAISFGYVFFDESYSIVIYLGMMLVLVGVFLNIWFKHRLHRDQSIFSGD